MELEKKDFDALRAIILRICGINLGDDKLYLVSNRLEPVAISRGCKSFEDFVNLARFALDTSLREQIISAITTNETSFFRDSKPFSLFSETILPSLVNARRNKPVNLRTINILSAGSSTGQEAYSLSILIHEHLRFQRYPDFSEKDFRIIGGDISNQALARAIAGEYPETDICRGLSDIQKNIYFDFDPASRMWIIKPHLKKIVEFRKVNFIENFSHIGVFDLIFCRNMLIYFDTATRARIMDQFHTMLQPEGILVLGATENIYGITEKFTSVQKNDTIYYVSRQKHSDRQLHNLPVKDIRSIS